MVTRTRSALVAVVLIACGGHGGGPSGGGDGPSPPPIDAPPVVGVGSGLGAATFGDGELDAPSHGGTITFQQIGATGWYPSERDPAVGPCDAYQSSTCCLAKDEQTSDRLTPWDHELIVTLRGPMRIKQLAVYQPDAAGAWLLTSSWDQRTHAPAGLAFAGDKTETDGFAGTIGTECLVDVSTDLGFACGAGSTPFCPATTAAEHVGWAGSKMFVLLARMDGAAGVPGRCSNDDTGNWFDAPWIGLSLGELVRAGAFSSCQCYAKDPTQWYLGDGCGQFNAFEVVNDNNASKNLGVFSTNFFGYAGYVGEGPCGAACNVSTLAAGVDLIDKAHDTEATTGAVATPGGGPGAAFRRPDAGYRYFVILMDVDARTVQLALVHPRAIPGELGALLPDLPAMVPQSTIDHALALRLPK
jgi:Cell wall protein YJL171C/Tos1, N-terminal